MRDEHINHVPRSEQAFVRSKVFTYRRRITGIDEREIDAQLAVWANGWRSVGWNPIVLTPRDAEEHPQYMEYMARVACFPAIGNAEQNSAKWERWLALDGAGGGLLTEFDVLPSTGFKPDSLAAGKGFRLLSGNAQTVRLATSDADGVKQFLAATLAYVPANDDKSVTDAKIIAKGFDGVAEPLDLVRDRGVSGWRDAKCVHFNAKSVAATLPGVTPSRAMTGYIRGE